MRTSAPPRDVYLDTSIVVAAIVPGSHHSGACSAFCNDLVVAGSHVYFSQIMRLELSQAILKLATRRQTLPPGTRMAFRLEDWGVDQSVRERWLRSGVHRFGEFVARFREAVELPFDVAAWHASLEVMIASGLQSHDAIHIATARLFGVRAIATADDHFTRVAGEFDVLLIQDGAYP